MKSTIFLKNDIKSLFDDGRIQELFELLYNANQHGYYKKCFAIIENIFIAQLNEFEKGKIYLPEYLEIISRYNNLLSLLSKKNMVVSRKKLRVYVCSPKNDLHSIGRNLIISTLLSMGVQVFDGGATLTPKEVVDDAINKEANIIAISAMLLNTRCFIEKVIEELELKRYGDKIKVFIGGAAVDSEYSKNVDAYYARNVVTSVKKIISFEKRGKYNEGIN